MTERRMFIEAILADLDADLPRLAFADWLEETGDTARAEFIRLQCARARMPPGGPGAAESVRRENEIIQAHAAEWLSHLPETQGPPWRRWYGPDSPPLDSPNALWSRGCLRGVELDCSEFVGCLEEALEREMFEEVTLRLVDTGDGPPGEDATAWLRRLVCCPYLRVVTGLVEPDPDFCMDGHLRELLKSPHLVGLQKIDFSDSIVTAEDIRALVESPSPFQLRELNLSGAFGEYVGESDEATEALRLLAASPQMASLERLELYFSGVRSAGLRALADSPYLKESLDLDFGEADGEDQWLPPDDLYDRLRDRFIGFYIHTD